MTLSNPEATSDKSMMITEYHAKYFAYELTKRSASNSLQKLASTLLDAQVDLNPHQVEAALFAFNSPLSKGAVLADEVGLGKTIEAGLVISQKWAERKRKILIIVPSNLRKQWNQELQDKFFLPSVILESSSFNKEIKNRNLNPFNQKEIVICSYHFARSKDVYIQQIEWDLVIIDEAHRLRNVYKKQNKIANAIKTAVANYPKILLTATPLQNTLLELYGLVSVIDDYIFGDLKSFKIQFSRIINEESFDDLKDRLRPICKRTLRRQVLEYIKYTNRIAITQEFIPFDSEHTLYELVSSYLQREKLYALPAGQRQLMTLILRKLLASSTFAISITLDRLVKKLELILSSKAKQEEFDLELGNDVENYDEVQDEWQEEEQQPLFAKEEKELTLEEIEEIKNEILDLKKYSQLAESISQNAKGEVLLKALKRGFSETERLGGNKKAIIFTESKRTQQYLVSILENTEFRDKIVLFNGTNNDLKSKGIYSNWLERYKDTDRISGSKTADMRAAIVDYFRDEATIMIATEAAAEGINLQFCSLVVNYDLPWNPQRIEQRIGRCHRYGQKFDVVVVNFINKKNAADQRVYELLQEKFQLFSGVFGASDEVLGTIESIESGVDFEKRILEIYQNCRTEDEIQLTFDMLKKELEDQIEDKMKNTRQKLLENFDEEVHEKLKVNLRESREYLSKYEEWLWQVTKFYLKDYAQFDGEDHSFYLVKNPFEKEKIHPGPYKIGKNIDNANIYRIGHPLSQRIIENCKSIELPTTELVFKYNGLPKISIIEPLIGKSGWILATNLTISSLENEDDVLFAGITDDGKIIETDQCRRLFSLPAENTALSDFMNDNIKNRLNQIIHSQQEDIIQGISERNSDYFDTELEKLDKWAEDVKNSLEIQLKQLDKEIKFRKSEAKKMIKLEDKVNAQQYIKKLEKRRNTMRMNLYEAQDKVDDKKEKLIDEIQKRLKQSINISNIFTIKWRIV